MSFPEAVRVRLTVWASRHVNIDFWPKFCSAAGVFCIGEVFDDDVGCVSKVTGYMRVV